MATAIRQSYPQGVRDVGVTGPRIALVGGAGAPFGQELAEQLVARGLRVHSADVRSMRVPSVSSHVVPTLDDPGYLPALSRLVRRNEIDVVIPVSVLAVQAVSVGRFALDPEVGVVAPSAGAAAIVRDRLLVSSKLWSHGLTVPNFGVPSDFADASTALRRMQGELVLRPRFIDNGHTSSLVRTAADLDWATLDDDILVQQFVAGAAYAVVIHRPADGGRRLTAVLEKTIRADGEVVTSRVRRDETVGNVERIAQAAVRALGLTGPAEVMIRKNEGGTPIVLDVSAGFGPHSRLVPELLDAVLDEHISTSEASERRTAVGEKPSGAGGGGGHRHARRQRR